MKMILYSSHTSYNIVKLRYGIPEGAVSSHHSGDQIQFEASVLVKGIECYLPARQGEEGGVT